MRKHKNLMKRLLMLFMTVFALSFAVPNVSFAVPVTVEADETEAPGTTDTKGGATGDYSIDVNKLTGTDKAFEAVIKIIRLVVGVVGILFLLVGIVRFTIAHSNEDGPQQQKASMLIATGIALIALVALISTLGIDRGLLTTILGS